MAPGDWPQGGLRALVDGPTRPLALLVVPSRDMTGRNFPLAACAEGGASVAAVDAWAAGILPDLLAATKGDLTVQELATALAATAIDQGGAADPPLAWATGVDPGPPEAVLAALQGAGQDGD